jgi:hypothetical protein
MEGDIQRYVFGNNGEGKIAMSELQKNIQNPLTGNYYVHDPLELEIKPESELKTRRKGKSRMGRPRLNPKGKGRRATCVHLDQETHLLLRILQTHAKTKRSIQSKSGLIEWLIWEAGKSLCPNYEKLLKRPPEL